MADQKDRHTEQRHRRHPQQIKAKVQLPEDQEWEKREPSQLEEHAQNVTEFRHSGSTHVAGVWQRAGVLCSQDTVRESAAVGQRTMPPLCDSSAPRE